MLLLDTHVLVWLDEGNPRLGATALHHINAALAAPLHMRWRRNSTP